MPWNKRVLDDDGNPPTNDTIYILEDADMVPSPDALGEIPDDGPVTEEKTHHDRVMVEESGWIAVVDESVGPDDVEQTFNFYPPRTIDRVVGIESEDKVDLGIAMWHMSNGWVRSVDTDREWLEENDVFVQLLPPHRAPVYALDMY